MIACAHLASKFCWPILDIPLETFGRNDTRLLDRDNTDVLGEGLAARAHRCAGAGIGLADVDAMLPSFEEERQALARKEEHLAICVCRRGLKEVQVMQLAQPLVHASSKSAHADNVPAREFSADEPNSFGEVGGVLVRVVDDGTMCWFGGEEVPRFIGQRV